MKKASHNQKDIIVDILSRSFDDNKSINFIVPQDEKRRKRIKALMAYSYEICSMFGQVLITDDESACALLLYPDKKRTSFRSVFWIFNSCSNVLAFRISRKLQIEKR